VTDPATDRCVEALETAAEVHRRAARVLAGNVSVAASRLSAALAGGNSVLVCGNGGSAAESQHFAAELTGRFKRERQAWPVIALTVDTSALTAIGNDYGFERVFARQVEAYGRTGDVLAAADAAHARGMAVIALTGAMAGPLGERADVVLAVPESDTARVQEVHLTVLHVLCDEIERALAAEA
jgi:D-sedoheptulose 7-phosphate isomerase